MADIAGSQPDLLSQITVDSAVLQRFFLSEKQARMTPFAGNVKHISDLYIDAAEVLHKGNAKTKVEQIKEDLLALLTIGAEVDCFAITMDTLARQYSADLKTTDFQNHVSQLVSQAQASKQFDPANQAKYQNLCQLMSAEEGADQDEDVLLEGGQNIELNTTCPITALSIYELEDPVEDDKGVVYENQAILGYLRSRSGRAPCPVSGMSHEINTSCLRKSRRILREQKRRKEQQEQAGGLDEEDDDGVDVE